MSSLPWSSWASASLRAPWAGPLRKWRTGVLFLLFSSHSAERIQSKWPSVCIMAGSRNAPLSRRSLVYPADLIAGDDRLVEPDANIDPGHATAGESEGVDKPAQRRAPSGSPAAKDRLRHQTGLARAAREAGQSRWGERVDFDHGGDLLFHVQISVEKGCSGSVIPTATNGYAGAIIAMTRLASSGSCRALAGLRSDRTSARILSASASSAVRRMSACVY
jgi:hypothetical protein